MALTTTLRLPLTFDPARLQNDFAGLTEQDWVPHFNRAYYEGDWSAVPLRSIGGRSDHIYSDPVRRDFESTSILHRCPYLQEVLTAFPCPLLAVRLLRLKSGSRIREHTDLNLGYEDGEIRIHVPIHTNADVEFYLAGARVILCEGECWYINTSLPHRVVNGGAADRIHLVIDCVVDDWVRAMFEDPSRRAGARD
jgi:hypothetical protein